VKWFANKANGSNIKNPVPIPPAPVCSTSKPRAVTALDLFAKDHASDIRQEMAAKRTAEGTTPQQSNLNYHREIKSRLFNDSDNTIKAEYEAKATALNSRHNSPPEPSEIYKYVYLLQCLLSHLIAFRGTNKISLLQHRLPCVLFVVGIGASTVMLPFFW